MYESHVGCHSDGAGRMAGETLLEFSKLRTGMLKYPAMNKTIL